MERAEYAKPIYRAGIVGLDLAHVVERLGDGIGPVPIRRIVERIQLAAQHRASERAQRVANAHRVGGERGGIGGHFGLWTYRARASVPFGAH